MTVSDVVGMDGAEAQQGRGGERDAGRATDVLHLLHLTYTSLEYAEEKPQQELDQLFNFQTSI